MVKKVLDRTVISAQINLLCLVMIIACLCFYVSPAGIMQVLFMIIVQGWWFASRVLFSICWTACWMKGRF